MRIVAAVFVIGMFAGCHRAQTEDYAVARRSFHTKLLERAPSPQPGNPVTTPLGANRLELDSGGLKLVAFVSATPAGISHQPAVLFLHGGFAYGDDDWDMTRPFRDAGFVVMVPILRGENGLPGTFSLFYDEVDDVVAAGELLAKQPQVDPTRIFISGHSAGGALTMLAAMTSKRFRAAAPLAGSPDASIFLRQPELIPFARDDPRELQMRSPLAFATSFKCPARLFVGEDETFHLAETRETARLANAAGLDVEAKVVAGDHFSMVAVAIPQAIAFFQVQR